MVGAALADVLASKIETFALQMARKIGKPVRFGRAEVEQGLHRSAHGIATTPPIFDRGGLAKWLVNLLEGGRREAEALMTDDFVDAVTITGSSMAGRSAHEI